MKALNLFRQSFTKIVYCFFSTDSVFTTPKRPLCNLVLGEGEAAWLKERSRGGWSRRRYFNLISVARQFMARGLESNLHKLIYFSDLNN